MRLYGKLLTLVLVVALVMLAGPALAQNKTLKVGVLGPFTGPTAKAGQEFRAATETAMERINYQVGDYKIELVWVDSQSDPAKATSAYTEAIEKHGVDAMIGNWHSSVAVALMDVAAQYKIPHISALGASVIINEKWDANPGKYRGYWMKSWPVPAKMFQGYIDCVEELIKSGQWKPKNKKVALWSEDTDWGHSALEAFKEGFKNTGWEIVSEEFFPTTQTDFYQMLGRYKSQQVSLIAGVSNFPAIGALIKQADEIKLGALIIADRLADVGNWYELTGKSSNYVLDMLPSLSTPEAQAWVKKVEDKYGFTPSALAGGLTYDGTGFFIKIIQAANDKYGEVTSEGIANILRDEVLPGRLTYGVKDGAIIMQEYKYSEETAPDPLIGPSYYFFPVVQYIDGEAFTIYPEVNKNADFVTPK